MAFHYDECVQETDTYLETVATAIEQTETKTVQDFLDDIEDPGICHIVCTMSRLTLQILLNESTEIYGLRNCLVSENY